jgi:FtsZ-interacting cell division protein ZipA
METNWILIITVIVAIILLIIFLIWRNQKDEKELIKKLNEEEDLSKPTEHDSEADQTED